MPRQVRPKAGEAAERSDDVVLGGVDVLGGNGGLHLLNLRRSAGFDVEALELDAHVVRDLLELLQFLFAGFQFGRPLDALFEVGDFGFELFRRADECDC